MPTRTSFAFSPKGQVFPRFAFLKITADVVAVTHHHIATTDGKEILRKRTDRLGTAAASAFIEVLNGLGYQECPGLG